MSLLAVVVCTWLTLWVVGFVVLAKTTTFLYSGTEKAIRARKYVPGRIDFFREMPDYWSQSWRSFKLATVLTIPAVFGAMWLIQFLDSTEGVVVAAVIGATFGFIIIRPKAAPGAYAMDAPGVVRSIQADPMATFVRAGLCQPSEACPPYRVMAHGDSVVELWVDTADDMEPGAIDNAIHRLIRVPWIRAHHARASEPRPGEVHIWMDLEPLPSGGSGRHVLDHVPVPAVGTIQAGLTVGNEVVSIDLQTTPMGIIFGPTRMGKSVAISSIAAQLLLARREDNSFDYERVIVATTKAKADFKMLVGAEVYGPLDQERFTTIVERLRDETEKRARWMDDAGYAKLDDVPLADRPGKTALIFDECPDWLRFPGGKDRDLSLEGRLAAAVTWFYRKSGSTGGVIILADQAPRFENFGPWASAIVGNAGFKICYGKIDEVTQNVMLGGGFDLHSAKLSIQGRGNVYMHSELTEFQGFIYGKDTAEHDASIRRDLEAARVEAGR